ncbi:MAG: hypothetical protein AB7V43_15430 [Acidimicrobiia bacterium]
MSAPDPIAEITEWFTAAVPTHWFVAPISVRVDREEILVVGALGDTSPPAVGGIDAGAIDAFREITRPDRVAIAQAAEQRFARKVSWGVEVAGRELLFSHTNVPVMTRLRMSERSVLDTLIDAGIARSRSEALAWCVRLVGRHESDWIEQLRVALAQVEQVRRSGPDVC